MKLIQLTERPCDFANYHVKKLSIEYAFSFIRPIGRKRKHLLVFGYKVHINKRKYKIFSKSLRCAECGVEPEFACLDVWKETEQFNPRPATFNFYGFSHGDLFMMTIDHVLPLHKGGTWAIGNLQSMCNYCNWKKGSRVKKEL